MDRELYVPRSWTSDPDHCRAAGLGDNTEFATKQELAARAAWVAGDEVYGVNLGLRTALEERGTGYVLAVACSHEVHHRRREVSRRHAGQEGAQEGLAEAVRMGRSQGPPLLRLTRHRPHGSPAREPATADPPQPQHRRTCLPLLLACRSAADHPGAPRWIKVAGRGVSQSVRRYPSWSRWVTLAMLAHAFLAVLRANEHEGLARRADTAHL